MPKTIDPQSLTPEECNQLYNFFSIESKLNHHVWAKEEIYSFPDGSLFQFPSLVIRRKRKTEEGFRYEFVNDDPYIKGGYGKIHEVLGTLALEPTTSRYKLAGAHKDKCRLVKVQEHFMRHPVEAMNEYALAKSFAPYLSVKEPVFRGFFSYSVMRRLKGRDLQYIIEDDVKDIERLTYQQRFELTLALLHALKEQVTDKDLIHCDLKPDNIIVDLTKEPIELHIIDFGLSIHKSKSSAKGGGTVYSAPEIFKNIGITEKTDVFSMGRILAAIWGIGSNTYDPEIPTKQKYRNAKRINLDSLFSRVPEADAQVRDVIKKALQGMVCENIEARYSVEQSIEALKELHMFSMRVVDLCEAPKEPLELEQLFLSVVL